MIALSASSRSYLPRSCSTDEALHGWQMRSISRIPRLRSNLPLPTAHLPGWAHASIYCQTQTQCTSSAPVTRALPAARATSRPASVNPEVATTTWARWRRYKRARRSVARLLPTLRAVRCSGTVPRRVRGRTSACCRRLRPTIHHTLLSTTPPAYRAPTLECAAKHARALHPPLPRRRRNPCVPSRQRVDRARQPLSHGHRGRPRPPLRPKPPLRPRPPLRARLRRR